MDTIFNHLLYGKCTLIPNFKFKPVTYVHEVKVISYVNLTTGEIHDSGTYDAGILTREGKINSKVINKDTLIDFGYISI